VKGELPKGWVWTNLEMIVSSISNGITEKQNKKGLGIPVTRIETISNGTINMDRVGYLQNIDNILVEKYRLSIGDILFSNINSDFHLGKTAIFEIENEVILHGMNLLRIKPIKNYVSPHFLNYLFNYYRYSGVFISIAQHAVNQSSINQTKLKNLEVPLPPLTEQQRIVNKIGELFTNLDKGIESLEQVKYKLKVYRQAILKYAMEGKLTEKWREKNKDKLKFSPEINSLIKGKIQNEELDYIRKICFIEIPNDWIWSSVGNIGEVFGGKRIPKGYVISDSKTNHPYIRVTDFSNYGVKREGLKYLENEIYNFIKRYIITKNDVYISIAGSIGKVGTIPEDLDNANLTENAARIVSSIYNNRLMAYFLNSEFCQLQISRYTIHTNQPKLALFRIKKLIIPLPPLEEQNIIVERIEKLFSLADYIEETVDSKLEESKTLRQSILKKAFEGKLVPQDPKGEPAEILLEKIKKQRLNKEKIVQEKLI